MTKGENYLGELGSIAVGLVWGWLLVIRGAAAPSRGYSWAFLAVGTAAVVVFTALTAPLTTTWPLLVAILLGIGIHSALRRALRELGDSN